MENKSHVWNHQPVLFYLKIWSFHVTSFEDEQDWPRWGGQKIEYPQFSDGSVIIVPIKIAIDCYCILYTQKSKQTQMLLRNSTFHQCLCEAFDGPNCPNGRLSKHMLGRAIKTGKNAAAIAIVQYVPVHVQINPNHGEQ